MKTIEERFDEFYKLDGIKPDTTEYHIAKAFWLQSAKEQEAIDVENTITCLKEQKMAIIDRVFKALDNIYFANNDARKDAKKILKNAIERERK